MNAKQYIRLMGGALSSSPNCRKLDRYCTKISRMFFYKRVSKRVSFASLSAFGDGGSLALVRYR